MAINQVLFHSDFIYLSDFARSFYAFHFFVFSFFLFFAHSDLKETVATVMRLDFQDVDYCIRHSFITYSCQSEL